MKKIILLLLLTLLPVIESFSQSESDALIISSRSYLVWDKEGDDEDKEGLVLILVEPSIMRISVIWAPGEVEEVKYIYETTEDEMTIWSLQDKKYANMIMLGSSHIILIEDGMTRGVSFSIEHALKTNISLFREYLQEKIKEME